MPPKQVSKTGFVGAFGAKLLEAHKAHANEETKYGNMGDLPAGISGGTCKLKDLEIRQVKEGKQNAGQWQFFARAIVKTPVEFNGMRTAGCSTMIIEPLYETPTKTRKTFDQHMAWVYNTLRQLGLDTSALDPTKLEEEMKNLKDILSSPDGPLIRFRTYVLPKRPKTDPKYNEKYDGPNAEQMVFHEWQGLVTDENGSTVTSEGTVGEVHDDSANGGEEIPHEVTSEEPETTTVTEAVEAEEAEVDWVALGKDADNAKSKTHEDSQAKLTEKANELGMTDDQMAKTKNWAAVAKYIVDQLAAGATAASEVEEGEVEEETTEEETTTEEEVVEDTGPKVGEMCKFAPKDPADKTGKKRLKPVACEIEEVDAAGEKVTLVNMANRKLKYKGVPFAMLDFS